MPRSISTAEAAGEALELLGATRPRGARGGASWGPWGISQAQRGRLWAARQGGWGGGLSPPTPTPLEHPWGWPNPSSFTSAQPALGNPTRTCPGLSDPFQALRPLQVEKGADGGHHTRG